MFGLNPDNYRELKQAIARFSLIDKAIIYGSRARGTEHEGSDIDITLLGENLTLNNTVYPLNEAIDELYLPYSFDISIFDDLNHAGLISEINNEGKIFYQKMLVSRPKLRKKSMKNLEKVSLGNVSTFVRGLTYSKKDEVDKSSTAVLRATNIAKSTNRLVLEDIRYISDAVEIKPEKIARRDDILICTASGSKSHLGKVALIEDDLKMAFGGFMGVLRTQKKCLPQFLINVLISQQFKNHVKGLSDGANINNLKFSQIEDFKFILPSLSEQKHIVAKLDSVFGQIDLAIAAAEKRLAEVKSLKSSVLQSIFIEKPDWKTAKLGEICLVRRGTTLTKKQTVKGNIPVIGGGMKPIYYHNKHNRDSGSVTVSGSGASAGYVNYWPFPVFASDCTTIEPLDNSQNKRYIYFYILSHQQHIYDEFRKGAAQPHVYAKDIALLHYPVVSITEQKRIVAKLDEIFENAALATQGINRQLECYRTLKSAILSSELGMPT